MLFIFKPFSTEKKIGEAYNAHCSMVPNDDDWVLILDYDSMILSPKAFKIIEKAIQRYPDTKIFGAYANRIGHNYQRLTEDMPKNDSIRLWTKIAGEQADQYADGQCMNIPSVAGFFMLFKKSYWKENPFQESIYNDRNMMFDESFCRSARRKGQPMRLIMGVVCWHSYRIMKENFKDTSHLRIFE